ncbi:MAG TPA: tetratricopeptide repeat protein [Geobacteraceae bacterium]
MNRVDPPAAAHEFPPAHRPAASAQGSRLVVFAVFAAITATTLLAYWRLPANLFVVYDDPEYITENIYVNKGLTWQGVVWAFSAVHEGNWHPLTWLSHMLDVELLGLNPAGHHAMALLLHLANALLLFSTLRRMTGALWRSVAVALFFALHPLHVESVAWAAERKDLLCAFFWLLTLRAYHFYTQRPWWGRYGLVAMTFACGLLSKPMAVTLPFVLLLLDWWPLERIRPGGIRLAGAIGEKLPLLALSALASLVTYNAQLKVAVIGHHSLLYNFGNALQSYVAYLAKTFWPAGLAIIYPFSYARITLWPSLGAAFFLMVVTVWCLSQARRRPYLAVGWLWYVGTLVPVIGIVRVGIMSMADRYTYIPHIGFFVMVAWGAAELAGHHPLRQRLFGAATIIALVLCALVTSHQLRFWYNGITLMTRAIAVTDNNWFAYNNLGAAYILVGTHNRFVNISASLPLDPATPDRRLAYLRRAVELCGESVRIEPQFPLSRFNLGLAHLNLGEREEAMAQYEALLRMSPELAANLRLLLNQGQRVE